LNDAGESQLDFDDGRVQLGTRGRRFHGR
jgi:hypothetical protein